MTAMAVMPREAKEWTNEDLDLVPEDGLQYELLDGLLLVSPAPVPVHQRVSASLHLLLGPACPPELEVFYAPLDWRPDARTSLQPDLLVVHRGDVGPKYICEPLVLAIEILSPSTRRKDLVLKRSKYEDVGVASYWVVDPDEPAVVVHDLVGGRYVQTGRASGSESLRVELPFPLTLTPSALVNR